MFIVFHYPLIDAVKDAIIVNNNLQSSIQLQCLHICHLAFPIVFQHTLHGAQRNERKK